MEGNRTRSLAVLFVSAAGLAVYVGVFHQHLLWLVILLVAVAAVGLLSLMAGHLLMGQHPVASVWLLQLIPLASLAMAVLLTFAAARAGVVVRQHLEQLPKAENDTLAEAIGAVTAGAVGWLALNGLADRASWFWPLHHVKKEFDRCYRELWKSGTAAADAIYADYVPGAKPPIRGWGFSARRRRATEIRAALTGNGTPPFEQPPPQITTGPR